VRGFFDRVNTALMLGMVVVAIWVWPRLPDQIPTHFGLDGQPDAWSEKSLLSWFLLPAVAILLVAMMGVLRWVLPKKPRWVNLPDKTRLTDLPEVARGPVLEMLSGFLAVVQTEMLIIFALIQYGTYRGAMGQESQGVMILVLILAIMASPALLVVFFLSLQRALDKGKELAKEQGEQREPGAGEFSLSG
jgi:uncharacterized membrane protein